VKVVVTGGAGFIGANLVRSLLACSSVSEVVVVDDLSTGSKANLDGVDATLVEASILDREALDEAYTNVDAVVHLAALPSVSRSVVDPATSHRVNATGTIEVLEAARRAGGPHVIVASSSSVYGANPALPKHENLRAAPLSPYAASKLATESYALAYAHCYHLPVLAFRFFNVFGPLQPANHAYAAVVPAFVSAALAEQPLTVFGDGNQTRDFTYVGSVCSVLTETLLHRIASADPVNLAFGTRTSWLQLVGTLEDVLGASVQVHHAAPRAGDVRDSQADTAALRRLFPETEPVSMRQGLAETIEWFRTSAG
jgi:UDP-glucose 4-epimerase